MTGIPNLFQDPDRKGCHWILLIYFSSIFYMLLYSKYSTNSRSQKLMSKIAYKSRASIQGNHIDKCVCVYIWVFIYFFSLYIFIHLFIHTHTHHPVYTNLAAGDEVKTHHFSHHPASLPDMQALTNFSSPTAVISRKERSKDLTCLLFLMDGRLETVIFHQRSKLVCEILKRKVLELPKTTTYHLHSLAHHRKTCKPICQCAASHTDTWVSNKLVEAAFPPEFLILLPLALTYSQERSHRNLSL